MKLLVSDANIFIDMAVAGIIRLMFQLQAEIAVPDILYEEELRQHHPDLPGYGLRKCRSERLVMANCRAT
jgi:hypothetical protein